MRFSLVFTLLLFAFCRANAQSSPLVIAYVFPQTSTLTVAQFQPHTLDRINFAFSSIEDGRMTTLFPTDAANFAVLAEVRRADPSLKLLVSVGGWLGSGKFSEMASTHKSRALFIQSVMEFLARYQLDGLDIDWEYPGQPGAGHPYLAADKQNYTALVKELRARFDAEARRTGKKLYLSVAAGASGDFLAHTQMKKVAQYVDTVNLMSYDYYEPGSDPITGHHAPLYRNPADPEGVSSDASVRAFEKAGVPARKIVLGIPFYGHVWRDVPDVNHGLYQPGKAPLTGGSFVNYSQILSSMLGHGYDRYWDDAAHAPYLYNPASHTFVSYEDPQSVAEKCRYVLSQKLGGIMFWYYGADNGDLLKVVDTNLHAK